MPASDAPADMALISALREQASNYEHDVAVAKDGSLFVSDDYAGAIYRISYAGK